MLLLAGLRVHHNSLDLRRVGFSCPIHDTWKDKLNVNNKKYIYHLDSVHAKPIFEHNFFIFGNPAHLNMLKMVQLKKGFQIEISV